MYVFVWEALCAGASPVRPVPASLLREGRAMLAALVDDLLHIDGCRAVAIATADVAGEFPLKHPRLELHPCLPADEPKLFDRLAEAADATWIVAPEIDGLLERRLRRAVHVGGRIVGPAIPAVALCADKLLLARKLEAIGVPTIPTASEWNGEYPVVFKPRFGAGSLDCRLVSGPDDLRPVSAGTATQETETVVQPFVAGDPLSTAAIVREGERIDVFPVGRQRLGGDGTFQYRGGRIPADVRCREFIENTVKRVCREIDGLRGYVGFDFVSPADAPETALLVEINPRLTTAYIGYREATSANLAARVLSADRCDEPIAWSATAVEFAADGSVSAARGGARQSPSSVETS